MNTIPTKIEGLFIIEPRIFEDERGYFFESFNQQKFEAAIGHSIHFVQDNESKSTKGVLRGLHFQKGEHAQAKLVRVTEGEVYDVAVDLRPNSPTYGQWEGVLLTAENKRQFFVPRGFAHGFVVLSETAVFNYKCDNFYHKEAESGIKYDDPTLNIDWKLPKEALILSQKDLEHGYL
ncbi:MAG: dTDP-4-dehydrorhamnose 3,5-epimerase [Saprospiraceae bacterium]|nr:dTDP-4-dehydrorhamnose 3,5-epimerase [Saprospiraceae bacterium]